MNKTFNMGQNELKMYHHKKAFLLFPINIIFLYVIFYLL